MVVYLFAFVLCSFLVPLSLLGPVYRVLFIQLQHLHFLLDGLHVSSVCVFSAELSGQRQRSVAGTDVARSTRGAGLSGSGRARGWNSPSAARDPDLFFSVDPRGEVAHI